MNKIFQFKQTRNTNHQNQIFNKSPGSAVEQFKTLDQKREIVQNIMEQLYENNLVPSEYEEIHILFKLMGTYIRENKAILINIKIAKLNKKIVGILPNKINESPWLNLDKN
jgi:hypothetical protein